MKKILIRIFLVVFVVFLFVSIFHIVGPIKKVDELISYANKTDYEEFISANEKGFISEEGYKNIRVSDFSVNEDEFVNVKNKISIEAISFSSITLNCRTKATVDSLEDVVEKKEYSANKRIVISYQNWKWKIVSVRNEQ